MTSSARRFARRPRPRASLDDDSARSLHLSPPRARTRPSPSRARATARRRDEGAVTLEKHSTVDSRARVRVRRARRARLGVMTDDSISRPRQRARGVPHTSSTVEDASTSVRGDGDARVERVDARDADDDGATRRARDDERARGHGTGGGTRGGAHARGASLASIERARAMGDGSETVVCSFGDVREDARARAVTRGRWARDRPIGRWFALPRRGAIGEPMPASRAPRRARESERD